MQYLIAIHQFSFLLVFLKSLWYNKMSSNMNFAPKGDLFHPKGERAHESKAKSASAGKSAGLFHGSDPVYGHDGHLFVESGRGPAYHRAGAGTV